MNNDNNYILDDIKTKRQLELQGSINQRIELPYGSLFEIGMGINLKGDVFASALEFEISDIEKTPNHSKGNCTVF